MGRRRSNGSLSVKGALNLIVLALIAAVVLFTWIGWVWLFIFAVIAGAVFVVAHMNKTHEKVAKEKSQLKTVDEYVCRLVRHELNLTEQRNWRAQLNYGAWSMDAERALRCVEVLAQSSYHALNSKNQDTATSNYKTLQVEWRRFNGDRVQDEAGPIDCRPYYLPYTNEEIKRCYELTTAKYHNSRLTNQVNGILEKAEKLKTEKARMRYYGQAMEAVEKASVEGHASIDVINPLREKVQGFLKPLEIGDAVSVG